VLVSAELNYTDSCSIGGLEACFDGKVGGRSDNAWPSRLRRVTLEVNWSDPLSVPVETSATLVSAMP